ncbi:MAG: 23S rRNA (adenine(2503)-C(2))-methyltransferase RlmN, partial [Candidatus Latescibacteria bacterium]|nr:23S rRNA (adenine(2503)-C(2))-methyltransferase RlmN [Candidatus Latescibacterota bacterium]
ESFDEMTNLPIRFREEIKFSCTIGAVKKLDEFSSSDNSTDKFLWELHDGHRIESVIIRDEGRITACISSQVGCKMACTFCRTGSMGFKRNLTSGEIVDQLIKMRTILKIQGEDITNIVFMGMGDPLDNLDAVLKSIKIINMETGLSIGMRKITVSTCGIVPGIYRLTREFRRIGLAISLNAVEDSVRTMLMPINRHYPLEQLLKASKEYVKLTKRRITFEYILIAGVNDSVEHAKKLLELARKIPCKINLIIFNEFDESPHNSPTEDKVAAFQNVLVNGHITAFLRKSKGTDILAACGQLATKNKQE